MPCACPCKLLGACPCLLVSCACLRACPFSLAGGDQPFVSHDEDCYHPLLVPEVGSAASLRILTLNVTSIRKHKFWTWMLTRLAAKNWRAAWGVPVGSQDRVADSHVAAHRGAIVLAITR
eukprot:4904669-Amphidinium_carterae.3